MNSESDTSDRRSQAASSCYFTSLGAAAECLARVSALVGAPYRSRLLRMARRLAFASEPDAMEASSRMLEADLADFAESYESYQRESIAGTTRILSDLTNSLRTMARRHAAELEWLQAAVERMRIASDLDDPEHLRRMLRQQTIGLASVAERLEAEQRVLCDALELRVRDLAAWLEPGEPALGIDSATGCLTRAALERHLRRNRALEVPFCLLAIRCAASPPQRLEDAMVKVAERLGQEVRPRDIVARWSENSFVVVFEAQRKNAHPRAAQISRWLSDRYKISSDVRILVRTQIEVIEPEDGELTGALLERVDNANAGDNTLAVAAL